MRSFEVARGPRTWRHVVLVLGVAFALEHVRAAVWLYLEYQPAIDTTMRGEFMKLESEMRGALLERALQDRQLSGAERMELEDIFQNFHKKGLRYFKHAHPVGDYDVEFGERASSPEMDERYELRMKRTWIAEDRVYWAAPPLVEKEHEAFGLAGPRPSSADRLDVGPPMPITVVVEIEPVESLGLERDARRALGVGLLGGVLVLMGSVALWWILGRREELRERLEERELLASLGKMSSVISQEMRAPLAEVIERIEQLEQRVALGRRRRRVGKIRHELGRLEALSNNLMEFVNSGRIERRDVDLAAWLDEVRARHDIARVELEARGDLPAHVSLDPVMMGRALDNLLENALSLSG
ncbi:MAG: hypothetical protein AAGI01_05115, partial [Myxococcota bacterium]